MKTAMHRIEAQRIADAIVAEVGKACERIEIVGSLRRRRPTVGDIELLVIPKMRPGGLFGGLTDSLLDDALKALGAEGRLRRLMGASRYRQYEIVRHAPLALDLFIVDADTWALQQMIRTGPAEFARAMVTPQCRGGLMPDGLHVHDGRVWSVRRRPDGTIPPGELVVPFQLTEESHVFSRYGMPWIEPADRDDYLNTARRATR